MVDDGGHAFPLPFVKFEDGRGYTQIETADDIGYGGMSLRDYFAAAALARIGALPAVPITEHARLAYEMADAMLKARTKAPDVPGSQP